MYVNFSGDFVPYVVYLGGPESGISAEDKVLLNSVPPNSVGHKWLWWWNQTGKDPFIDEYEKLECKLFLLITLLYFNINITIIL